MKLLVYTKRGNKIYQSGNKQNYPDHVGYNCDLNDSVHIAISKDGKKFMPMRNNTGVLFAEADFTSDEIGGTTKTLLYPYVFRTKEGKFGIVAVRRNRNAPDDKNIGSVMLFFSEDCVRFSKETFLPLSDREVSHPEIEWEKGEYRIRWQEGEECYQAFSSNLVSVNNKEKTQEIKKKRIKCNIRNAVCGNVIDISHAEGEQIQNAFGTIENTGVVVAPVTVRAGENAFEHFERIKATCYYSDGSTHVKSVDLNPKDFSKIDFTQKGVYSVRGKILREEYPFPFIKDENISDPAVMRYRGKYYLTCTRAREVVVRVSDTLQGLSSAEKIVLWRIPESEPDRENMWAQELHIIKGVPYIFTTVGKKEWTTVQAHILRCKGEIENPEDWEAPRLVVKCDGSPLEENGISLDMTYFEDRGNHYVMWSNRVIVDPDVKNPIADTADIFIATVDPDAPWQLTSDPVRILKPKYGWERCETNVEEGPYCIRRGEDIFITVSASSTGLADLYCIGLLHTKSGGNLLEPASWDFTPYPVLTKESVKGEFGPGHNTFVRNLDTDNDLLVYHAVPHDFFGKTKNRYMGIRRVHWTKDGRPYLEMTKYRDLKRKFERVLVKITVV